MRLAEDKIKAGVLHPERDVRDAAVMYFSRADCRDPSVLPLVIQAIEKYGPESAFIVPSVAEGLPISADTLPWVLRQLEGHRSTDGEITGAAWRRTLAWLLCDADAGLLSRHAAEILRARGLSNDDRDLIQTRIELLAVPPDTCWSELEAICQRASHERADPDTEYGYALVEALARHGEVERAISGLARKIEDVGDYGESWMELFLVNLAAELRLDAAVPHIVAKLRDAEKEADLLFEEGERALVQIGTDAAVEGAARLFSQGDWIRRMVGCYVFQHVHSDPAVARALEFLPHEEEPTVKACLARAVTSQFAEEAIQPVRQVVLSGRYDETFADLRLELLVAAALLEVDLPEKEQWKRDVERGRAEREKQIRFDAEPWPDEDEEEPVPLPTKRTGRNDPCPCGSGKKFKKCCMRKADGGDLFA